MSDERLVRTARVLAGVGIVGGIAGPLVLLIGGNRSVVGVAAGFATLAVGFGVLAWVVAPAQPRNRALWALILASPLWALQQISLVLRGLSGAVPENLDELNLLSAADLPLWAAIVMWPGRWTWPVAYFAPITFAILLFPDGRLPSSRWRLAGWFSALAIAVTSLPRLVLSFPTIGLTRGAGVGATLDAVGDLGFLAASAAGLLCWIGLFARYRSSPRDERSQIRFVVFGTVIFGTVFAASQVLDFLVSGSIDGSGAGADTMADELLQSLAIIVFLASYAVAIMKFRLYDLDVIVSKGAVYLALAAFITAVYMTLVISIGSLFGGVSNPLTSIVATTVVAVAFQPVRRRLERTANRLIFGHRATPYDVLAQFSRRAVTSDGNDLLHRIPTLVVESTSACQATIWVRNDTGFQAVSSWPGTPDVAGPAGDGFEVDGADRSIPVLQAGELLGGLSLVIAPGDAMTGPEEALLGDLTSGLGLVLRNGRMTADLKRRVAELEASRQRVLVAADDARRSLESSIEHGPRQQLVSLRAAMGAACAEARRTGADQLASLLDKLQADTDLAITTVQEFARGVYPRLLEAEGLTAALAEQATHMPIGTSVHSSGVGRYGPEVEAAVYFTVLEALQNTNKHANATSATVTLTDERDRLDFVITDNGQGFELTSTNGSGLNGLHDRLDSVGGRVHIDSTIGRGTTISGSVPV